MKLPKVNKKVATLVASGVIITSAATASALMITKPFDQTQKSSIETTQQVSESSSTPVTTLETEETTQPVTPTSSPTPTPEPSQGPVNTYAEDSMGYYVFNKRVAAGKVVGNWGFANSWAHFAKEAGLVVDRSPQKNDAAIAGQGIWFVESVNEDGSFVVSSYNAGTYGPGHVTRTVPAVQTQAWLFIH